MAWNPKFLVKFYIVRDNKYMQGVIYDHLCVIELLNFKVTSINFMRMHAPLEL